MEGRRSSCRLLVFLALNNMEGEMIVVVCGEGVIIKILLRVWLTHSAHLFVMVCVSVGGWCAGLRHAAWGTGLAELALLGLFSDLTSDRDSLHPGDRSELTDHCYCFYNSIITRSSDHL
jgi:hypothetical protein